MVVLIGQQPIAHRLSQVGGGASFVDVVTDGGRVGKVHVHLHAPGYCRITNGPLVIVDDDLDAGDHTFVVPLVDRWGLTDVASELEVGLSVRKQI